MPKRPSPPIAVNPQVERTKQALRDGLLAALASKPLDQLTQQELAGFAKVGYASFFRHYSSKEMLLREVVEQHVGRVMEIAMPFILAENSMAACQAFCRHVDENRAVWTTLVRSASETIRDVLIEANAKRHPRRTKEQRWVALELGRRMGVAATIELIRWWMDDPKSLSVEDAARVMNRMIVGPALAIP